MFQLPSQNVGHLCQKFFLYNTREDLYEKGIKPNQLNKERRKRSSKILYSIPKL